jgi:hypothetical protein
MFSPYSVGEIMTWTGGAHCGASQDLRVRGDMRMLRRMPRRWLAVGAVLVIATVTGAGLLIGAAAGDDERPITGEALQRASDAALAYTGEGRVTGTEVGDEEGYYEVEVTLDNGNQVDVHLDRDFNVIGTEHDGANDDEAADDD